VGIHPKYAVGEIMAGRRKRQVKANKLRVIGDWIPPRKKSGGNSLVSSHVLPAVNMKSRAMSSLHHSKEDTSIRGANL